MFSSLDRLESGLLHGVTVGFDKGACLVGRLYPMNDKGPHTSLWQALVLGTLPHREPGFSGSLLDRRATPVRAATRRRRGDGLTLYTDSLIRVQALCGKLLGALRPDP
jgi:hypothetical protein